MHLIPATVSAWAFWVVPLSAFLALAAFVPIIGFGQNLRHAWQFLVGFLATLTVAGAIIFGSLMWSTALYQQTTDANIQQLQRAAQQTYGLRLTAPEAQDLLGGKHAYNLAAVAGSTQPVGETTLRRGEALLALRLYKVGSEYKLYNTEPFRELTPRNQTAAV